MSNPATGEWTADYVFSIGNDLQAIADAHIAAIAAEREEWKTNGLNAVAGKEREIADLEQQLAAQREKVVNLAALADKWSSDNLQLREQLAAAVEALNKLKWAKDIYRSEYWHKDASGIIDAALAKISK